MKKIYTNALVNIFFLTLILLIPSVSFTQIIEGDLNIKKVSQQHILLFKIDQKMIGRIISMSDEKIWLKTEKKNILELNRNDILKIIVKDSYPTYSSHENLGYSTTAFNLQKGENRYSNFDGLMNIYGRGLTNNISFTGSLLVVPEFNDFALNFLFTSRIKFTHAIAKNIRLGISPTISYVYDGSRGFHSVLNGIITIGKPSKFLNLTFARGHFIKNSNEVSENSFRRAFDHFTLGGSIDLGKNWTIVIDNVLFIEEYDFDYINLFPSIMVKVKTKKNQFIQLGLYQTLEFDKRFWDDSIEVDWTIPIPIVAYSWFW